jgi:metal-responsive CopG/Arc/MetJ family transcriptional regulator
MQRTQIYLTEQEQSALRSLAEASGRSQSELIRDAVDRYLREVSPQAQRDALMGAAGMWRERDDLPDWAQLRAEWDRPTGT